MSDDDIRQFLESYGRAVSAGDVKTIADCWGVPGMVLSDNGVIAIADAAEVESFFAQAAEWYKSKGLVSTKPELERIEMLTTKIAAVDVRWPTFDESGGEQASERSHYILQLDPDGRVRVRVALTRTA